jgi:hypothetical protein
MTKYTSRTIITCTALACLAAVLIFVPHAAETLGLILLFVFFFFLI